MGYLRNTVLAGIMSGQPFTLGRFSFTGGLDHYDLMKPEYGDNPLEWPQAIRESVNILEFEAEHNGTKVKVVARPSGTEPKQKNLVMVIGTPEQGREEIDALNREIMDEIMKECYRASGAEYESQVLVRRGTYGVASLND